VEDDGAAPEQAPPGARRGKSFLRELPVLLLVAAVLALVVQGLVVQPFYIPSGSMERTLHGCPGCKGDRVLVDKVVYDRRSIARGEIVVFHGTGSFGDDLELPGAEDFIKRVIGLPGDRVACCDADGLLTVQPAGSDRPLPLPESYLFEDDDQPFCAAGLGAALCPPGAEGVLVPEGRLWVMGDHRSRSSDSRAHLADADQGTVPQDQVVGRAFAIVWPLQRMGLLGVPEEFALLER
jgi:signal peptidase I